MSDDRYRDSSLADEIAGYYDLGEEAGRLVDDAAGQLELVRSQELIGRYLPQPPAVVLDVGGGPGVYSCWLARLGYDVHLVDPQPLHLEQARQASERQPETPIQSFRQGDARRLDFPDAYADVVLLLGPLYHLTEGPDRLAALQEARRALKPGGRLFAVAISRFASTFSGFVEGLFADADFVAIARRGALEGQHRNPTDKPSYFTTAVFHRPEELRAEVQAAGFQVDELLAVEGAAVFVQDLDEQWADPQLRERLLEALRWLEAEPAVMGATGHIMAVASKPA